MATDAQKTEYLGALQACLTDLAQLGARAADLAHVFADRGYDAAAPDPITAAALAAYGVAPAGADSDAVYYLGSAVNLCQALAALCAGQATSANPAVPPTLSRWRHL